MPTMHMDLLLKTYFLAIKVHIYQSGSTWRQISSVNVHDFLRMIPVRNVQFTWDTFSSFNRL